MEDIKMSPPKLSDLQMASPPMKRHKSSAFKEADSLPLLEMVIDFKSRNGGVNPTPTNMKPLYDYAKATLLSAVNDFTPEQLYNRIRHLRVKYYKLRDSESVPTDRDLPFLELSARAWGDSKKISTVGRAPVPKEKMVAEKEEEEEEEEEMMDADAEAGNVGDSFALLNLNAKEYWAAMQLNARDLEMGLKSMDREKAKAMEAKWIQHSEEALKIQAKQAKLEKELFAALLSAQKGTKRNA